MVFGGNLKMTDKTLINMDEVTDKDEKDLDDT